MECPALCTYEVLDGFGSLINCLDFDNNNHETALSWLPSNVNKNTMQGIRICQLERTTCSLCEAPWRDQEGRKKE